MTLAQLETTALGRWVELVAPARQLAEVLAGTEFVPAALRGKPDAITATILYGDEVGLGPMQALVGIHVVEGRPGPSAELMRALILRAGHSFAVHEMTGTRCRVSGLRHGRPDQERVYVEWTVDMARAAGLLGRQNWQRYPRAMLLARATGDLGRVLFPDVVKGLGYVAEDDASAAELETWQASQEGGAAAEPATPARKPVQRRTKPTRKELGQPPQAPPDRPAAGRWHGPEDQEHSAATDDWQARQATATAPGAGAPPVPASPTAPPQVEQAPALADPAQGLAPPAPTEEPPVDRPPVAPPVPAQQQAEPPVELQPEAPAPEPGLPGQRIGDAPQRVLHASLGRILGRIPNQELDREQRRELVAAALGLESLDHIHNLTREQGYEAIGRLADIEQGRAGTHRDDQGRLHVKDFPAELVDDYRGAGEPDAWAQAKADPQQQELPYEDQELP